MLKTHVPTEGGRVLLVDSITQLVADDALSWVVTGSHGGSSSAQFALRWPMRLVVFNDAGVGKDGAGIVGLRMLQAQGVPAAAMAHDSARIGEARDGWEHGRLSHVNALAAALGLAPGQAVREAVALAQRATAPGG